MRMNCLQDQTPYLSNIWLNLVLNMWGHIVTEIALEYRDPLDLIGSVGGARSGVGWEEIDLLNVVTVCEEHGEPVNSHAPARGGGQPVLQGGQEVLVQEHRLVVPARLGKGRGSGVSGGQS